MQLAAEHRDLQAGVPPRHAVTARRILLVYVVAAAAWIGLSDLAAAALFPDAHDLAVAQTVKGWAFIAATGLMLGVLLRRYELERTRHTEALAERERTFRLLAEHARDVVFRYRVGPPPSVEYVSPSIEAALGYSPAQFYRQPALLASLMHPDDVPVLPVDPADVPESDLAIVRLRTSDDRWVPFEFHLGLQPAGSDGAVVVEGVARDITERVRHEAELNRLNRVLRTLSAANRALIRADTETALLDTICATIAEDGGFRFAWVGYLEADGRTVRPVAHAGHEAGYLSAVQFNATNPAYARGPVGTAIRDNRPMASQDIARDAVMAPWRGEAIQRGYASMVALPLTTRSDVFGALAIYGAEVSAFGTDEVALLEELAADLAYGIGVLRAREAHAAGEAERLRLAAAVSQSGESVVITDPQARIAYVNPAFERLTGYRRDEVIGGTPSVLKSGVQPPSFYATMWQTLTAGRTWVGDLVNRRKDGSLFTEESVISPIRDADGELAGYVAVKRDVTHLRAVEERDRTHARERTLIAEAISALRPDHGPEETADAICRQLVRLPEAAAAWLFVFDPGGTAIPLAGASRDDTPTTRAPVPPARTAQLRARAQEGPWVERWVPRRGHPYTDELRRRGVRAVAYAPFGLDGEVSGLLILAASSEIDAAGLTERLPALVEFAGIGGAVLGPSLLQRTRVEQARHGIRQILDESAFRPVFQPIINLESGEVEGYEALTRFTDGTPPDVRFAEATRVGLGIQLEAATLRAAVAAAAPLPTGAFLNANVSPAMVAAHEPLASIVAGSSRPVVLELTEHEAITDYAAFREAVTALGADLRLAVDDAGAGFASLRHVLELRPDIVKIDRSVVQGLEADPARQALVSGFRHLADSIACQLIAEGIETRAELAALRGLGITHGQGFLLGRPAPASELLAAG